MKEYSAPASRQDTCKRLDKIISQKLNILPVIAKKWQWRILHEYPDDLREAVYQWTADGSVQSVSYNEVSLEDIINGTGLNFLEAVDLLYIIFKDPVNGYRIYARSVRRCVKTNVRTP